MRVELAREGVERWPAKGKIATSEDRDGTKTHFHTSGKPHLMCVCMRTESEVGIATTLLNGILIFHCAHESLNSE